MFQNKPYCDKIIVLKQGRAIEIGSHQELLEMNGEYKSMWEIQSSDKKDNTKTSGDNVVSFLVFSDIKYHKYFYSKILCDRKNRLNFTFIL